MEKSSQRRARLGLFAAAFLFSTGGAAIKACSMGAWQVAGFRSAIAAVALLIALPQSRRRWTWKKAAIGCAYAATLIAFVAATKQTTAANAILLQSTAPLYMLALGPMVLGEANRRADLAVFGGVALGIVLLLKGSMVPSTGDLVALFSGLSWAVTLTGLRWLARRSPDPDAAIASTVIGNVIAFAICLPFAIPVHVPQLQDVAVLVYWACFRWLSLILF